MTRLALFLLSFLLILNLHAGSRVALITGTTKSLDYQILHRYLLKEHHQVETFDLSELKKFPFAKVFAFKKTTVVRLVERSVPESWMDLEEAEFWTDFLTARGSLVLFADTLGKPEVYKSSFPKYVGFKSRTRRISPGVVQGTNKDLIAQGMQLRLEAEHKTSIIRPQSGSGIDIIFRFKSGQVAGMKQQSCAFKMAYLAFLPSWLQNSDKQEKLTVNALDWTLGFSLNIGMQAPDFPILTLDGSRTGLYNDLAKFKDEIVVLEFFATWCSVCESQLPDMLKLRKRFQNQPVSFYFISYKESIETLRAYQANHPQMDWPISITENGLGAKRFGVKSLPSVYILDRDRVVRSIHKGRSQGTVLEAKIKEALQENQFGKLHP
jgi:thiol-disulfide isomerase/thioredoxin